MHFLAMSNPFKSSLEFLKSTPIQSVAQQDLIFHHRNLAEGFNKIFSSFAVEICGCENPADRVHLKKSVWQQTVGMRLLKFEKRDNRDSIVRIAQMECPVTIFPKSSDESSPSKIILSSKLLRAHFGVNESTTCRGCSKKGRCPFVHKTVANKNSKTSLGALTKVLFGIAQSCRLHLKEPEKYAFLMSAEEVEAAAELTENLRVFLEPSALERQLRNVPVADRNAVRAIVKKQLRKKEAVETEIKKKRKDGMSEWMRQQIGEPIEATTQTIPADDTKQLKFDIDADDWIPEEKVEEFSQTNLKFEDIKVPPAVETTEPSTILDSLHDLPIVKRFAKFDAVFTKKSLRKEEKLGKKLTSTPTPVGGYRIDSAPMEPSGGVEYIKPQLMKGKTVLDNVSIAGKLWGRTNPWITELKFLQRVPYTDSVPSSEPRVADDKVFREAAEHATSVKREERVPTESSVRTKPADLFHLWQTKRDKPKKVALIDKRFDYNDGCVGNDSLDQWTSAEIVTGSPREHLVCDFVDMSDTRRKKALEAALGQQKLTETDEYIETKSRLRFTKFPADPIKPERKASGLAPRSRGGVDINSLMRPAARKNINT